MSKAKRAKLSKKERAAAVRAKRKHDPVADRAGKGGKPINVSNFGKGKISEAVTVSITGDTADEVRQFFSGSTPNRREQYELSGNDAVKLLSLKEVVNDSEYVKEVRERGSNKGSGGSISRKKKRNTNQDFNAWYTGSQVEKYYKPNQLSEETETISEETQKESIDRGIESGMALNSYSKEFVNRRKGGKVVPFKELTGDTTTASIGAQKEDELKKKGISLRTFRAKRPIG